MSVQRAVIPAAVEGEAVAISRGVCVAKHGARGRLRDLAPHR